LVDAGLDQGLHIAPHGKRVPAANPLCGRCDGSCRVFDPGQHLRYRVCEWGMTCQALSSNSAQDCSKPARRNGTPRHATYLRHTSGSSDPRGASVSQKVSRAKSPTRSSRSR